MKKTLSALALWLLSVPAAQAQNLGSGVLNDVAEHADLRSESSLPEIVGNVIQVFIGMLGIVFLLLTVYAGFLYLTARGDAKKVADAKQTLQNGAIGIAIVTAAYVIASFVINAVTGVTAAGS